MYYVIWGSTRLRTSPPRMLGKMLNSQVCLLSSPHRAKKESVVDYQYKLCTFWTK